MFDALRLRFRELRLRRDPACPICGDAPTIHELVDYEAFCGLHDVDASGELSAAELRAERAAGRDMMLVDVREPHEWELGRIDGATLIPLGDLPSRLGDVDPRKAVVAYCQRGSRSRRAVEILRAAGFADVRSLAGGIEAWDRDNAS